MEHLAEVLELAAAEEATWGEKSAEIRASGVPVNMADFIAFNEGKTEMAANGLPATCHFLLTTKGVDAGTAHTAGETLAAADLGEITGTALCAARTRPSQRLSTAWSASRRCRGIPARRRTGLPVSAASCSPQDRPRRARRSARGISRQEVRHAISRQPTRRRT